MYTLKIKYKIYIKIIDIIKFFPTSITVIFVKMLFWKLNISNKIAIILI